MNSEAINSSDYKLAKVVIPDLVTFRNNVGMAYDKRGVPICYGVAGKPDPKKPSLGGSDYLGWTEVIVTPEMVGSRVAIFTAHELKSDERNRTKSLSAQENFIAQVNAAGGYAGFVLRPEDIQRIRERRGCTVLRDYPKSWLV